MLLNGHKIVYFGHSAFLVISQKNKTILIDPWISNPVNNKKLESVVNEVDYILVTHAHSDHIGDAVEIARNYNSEIISNFEITNYLGSKGISKLSGMNIGGTLKRGEISFTMVEASHSSTILEGERSIPGGNPCGFIITLEDRFKIYHMGDTGLFGGLNYIAELYKPDLVMIPIGGHYTMGIEEAAYALKILKPSIIIPMHYRTFPVIDANPEKLIELLPSELKEGVKILNPGDLLE
ncbi:MAG: metal-dependent hydrolase [bacterium]|nr:metal-dependent hydrolase [bacterium]